MSLLRLGRLPDGSRHVILEEPARARISGHGGAVAGYWAGTIVQAGTPVVMPRRVTLERPQPDPSEFEDRPIHPLLRPICGAPVRLGNGICYRKMGHGDFPGASRWARQHSSKESVAKRAAARRKAA